MDRHQNMFILNCMYFQYHPSSPPTSSNSEAASTQPNSILTCSFLIQTLTLTLFIKCTFLSYPQISYLNNIFLNICYSFTQQVPFLIIYHLEYQIWDGTMSHLLLLAVYLSSLLILVVFICQFCACWGGDWARVWEGWGCCEGQGVFGVGVNWYAANKIG